MTKAENVADLNRRFGIPGNAQVVEGHGGLPKVIVAVPAASGEMYLLGGHVTSWRPVGQEEVLFLSAATRWELGRAIRGGIPVCFPWFGNKADDAKAPAHGFVRTSQWQLESIVSSGDAVTVSMFTGSSADSKKWWPAEFHLLIRATFGSELRLELEMTNKGADALQFEEALHTYLRIGDITKMRIHGLDSVRYFDKTDAFRQKTQHGDLTMDKETDSVYLDTRHAVELEDPALRRRIHVGKENSLSTVVWNPWAEKAKAMSDFGDDEWKQMVCIETANVGQFAVTLAPAASHVIKAVISLSGT
jgi:glucose-6-phosphate 1-epimerase